MSLTAVKIANILLLFLEMAVPALMFLDKFQLRKHWLPRLFFVFTLTVVASWGLVWVKDCTMAHMVFSYENMVPHLLITSFFSWSASVWCSAWLHFPSV